jgi:ribonuclease VapC
MFIDASAIVAILGRERGAGALIDRIEQAGGPFTVSPLVRFEAALSLARSRKRARGRRPDARTIRRARKLVDDFLDEIGANEIAITAEIGDRALDAAIRYGKAVGHPAGLNFGDCFAYACARSQGLRLLYVGDDFAKTDLALDG